MILDTNATFLPFREALPLLEEVGRILPGAELAVPQVARAELDRLADRGAPHALAARGFARRLRTVRTEGRGDDALVVSAARWRATVVTADRALAARLRRNGVAVLVPRDRARLELKLPYPASPPPSARRGRRAVANR